MIYGVRRISDTQCTAGLIVIDRYTYGEYCNILFNVSACNSQASKNTREIVLGYPSRSHLDAKF
jgi:hypothetical protein